LATAEQPTAQNQTSGNHDWNGMMKKWNGRWLGGQLRQWSVPVGELELRYRGVRR